MPSPILLVEKYPCTNRCDKRFPHGTPVGGTRKIWQRCHLIAGRKYLASSREGGTGQTHDREPGIRGGCDIAVFACNLQQRKDNFCCTLRCFFCEDVDLFPDTRVSRFRRRVFHPGECELFDVKISDLIVSAPHINAKLTP